MIRKVFSSLQQQRQRGSAYVELLVVFVALVALFAIIVPTYFDYLDKAKLTLARNTINSVGKVLVAYKDQHQTYPLQIDFATGSDGGGREVLPPALLQQVQADFYAIDSYFGTATTYTLIVKANDENRTELLLTPGDVTF